MAACFNLSTLLEERRKAREKDFIALLAAARKGNAAAAARLLDQEGTNLHPNQGKGGTGYTALMTAAQHGQFGPAHVAT